MNHIHRNIDLEKDKVSSITDLDGALINIDTNVEILTPNKNIYFVGFILLALGSALIGYGVHRYFNVSGMTKNLSWQSNYE